MYSLVVSKNNSRRLIRQGFLSAVQADEEAVPVSEVKQMWARFRELKRLLDKKTMEAGILKEALEFFCDRKLLLRVVMKQLPRWSEDYNENHPHKGLKMMSPREYRQSLRNIAECPVS